LSQQAHMHYCSVLIIETPCLDITMVKSYCFDKMQQPYMVIQIHQI
jgi:hypothetical protein